MFDQPARLHIRLGARIDLRLRAGILAVKRFLSTFTGRSYHGARTEKGRGIGPG
jgi:hypothetical protein